MITKEDIKRLQERMKDEQYLEETSKIVAFKLADAMVKEIN